MQLSFWFCWFLIDLPAHRDVPQPMISAAYPPRSPEGSEISLPATTGELSHVESERSTSDPVEANRASSNGDRGAPIQTLIAAQPTLHDFEEGDDPAYYADTIERPILLTKIVPARFLAI